MAPEAAYSPEQLEGRDKEVVPELSRIFWKTHRWGERTRTEIASVWTWHLHYLGIRLSRLLYGGRRRTAPAEKAMITRPAPSMSLADGNDKLRISECAER